MNRLYPAESCLGATVPSTACSQASTYQPLLHQRLRTLPLQHSEVTGWSMRGAQSPRQDSLSIFSWLASRFPSFITAFNLAGIHSAKEVLKGFQVSEEPQTLGDKMNGHKSESHGKNKVNGEESSAREHGSKMHESKPQEGFKLEALQERHSLQHLCDSVVTAAPVTQEEVLLPAPSKAH